MYNTPTHKPYVVASSCGPDVLRVQRAVGSQALVGGNRVCSAKVLAVGVGAGGPALGRGRALVGRCVVVFVFHSEKTEGKRGVRVKWVGGI
jgi:hypothetical protein